MEDSQDAGLDQARKLLQSLNHPNAYTILGLQPGATAAEINLACSRAISHPSSTGYSSQEIAHARSRLFDREERLELETWQLDHEHWLRGLSYLRAYFAQYDFINEFRNLRT